VYLIGVYLLGVYLLGVYFMGVYLTDMHLISMHLASVYLMGVSHTHSSQGHTLRACILWEPVRQDTHRELAAIRNRTRTRSPETNWVGFFQPVIDHVIINALNAGV
jgi:hypothetical protein